MTRIASVRFSSLAAAGASLLLAACGGGGGGGSTPSVGAGGHPQIAALQYGRLVDVYGLRLTDQGATFSLYRRDVMIGPDISDERDTGSTLTDDQVRYDFLSADPDTLQPRLFIPRNLDSQEFKDLFARLDASVHTVVPMAFGQGGPGQPYSVVPRNAAFRLKFTSNVGIDDSFFYERDANGQIVGLRNTEALQVLQISGDPTQPNAFTPLAARYVVGNDNIIIDPVLLGTEGLQLQTRNNASGLPASPDQAGANIRIAVELAGAFAIPGITRDSAGALVGLNNAGINSVIRDFRSGNANDSSDDISRGFARDPLPARMVGEMLMYLERVDVVNQFTQEVTIFKNGILQEVDRGDVLRFLVDSNSAPVGSSEVVVDPDDDRGQPGVQHVRVRIRTIPGLDQIDPRRQPGYPAVESEREAWLVQHAPKAVLVAEFAAGGRTDPNTGLVIGDDPRYFATFSPTPLANLDGTPSAPNENVSPFAGVVIRFTKPVDLSTVKWADSMFFATRNLFDVDAKNDFIANRPNGTATPGMDPAAFDIEKYKTPHLVAARVFDEDGSQTALRLQPTAGFYLDNNMRNAPAGVDFHYYLHLLAGVGGIRDLSGNPIDLQADTPARHDSVVVPFTVDTRMNGARPFFEDNLAFSIVRRFASTDEDEQPSYYIPEEVQPVSGGPRNTSFALPDVFGACVLVNGQLQARPTTRARQIADNLNQAPVASQTTVLRWCPDVVAGEDQVAGNTSTTPFGQGIQNPLNPYGCRMQTVWREIDLSLSRVNPFDFNLDVEQMYWAPYIGSTIQFDEFDRVTLFLGHSERRPEPCVGNFSALATFPDSGLVNTFVDNYVHNMRANGGTNDKESQPNPWPAYVDAPLTIDPQRAVLEPNLVNRFLPLPTFRKPYFVYRDETVIEQGCVTGVGSDLTTNGRSVYNPWIISPWNNGNGRRVVQTGTSVTFVNSFWNNGVNYLLNNGGVADRFTDGLTGNVALPLLADFWTYCDTPDLPAGNGYIALGTNGWQVSLTVQSGAQPNFRVLSAGRTALGGQAPLCRSAGSSQWNSASGGFGTGGSTTPPGDNTFYWIMIDFLKRQSVVTNGFVDLLNPHRVPEGFADSRLGPFLSGGSSTLPAGTLPSFSYDFDPPLTQIPGGTSLVAQFRGATAVDGTPWYWDQWVNNGNIYNPVSIRPQLRPDATNFPLDPYKACDAHIRKYDDRPVPGGTANRNWWTYLYNRSVTGYVQDPNQVLDPAYLLRFAGPNDVLTPASIRYLNWRFLIGNNVDANPPVAPAIETFSLTYRFQRSR